MEGLVEGLAEGLWDGRRSWQDEWMNWKKGEEPLKDWRKERLQKWREGEMEEGELTERRSRIRREKDGWRG